MKQLKLVRVWVMIILVIAFFSAVIPSSVFAGGPTNGWSQGMWTTLLTPGQYDCVRYWWGGTEHCRKVITGLKFHPDALRCPTKNKVSGKCYYIVFNGQTQKLAMGFENKRNGYSDFLWGVPTLWPSWQGKWEFKLMNGTTW